MVYSLQEAEQKILDRKAFLPRLRELKQAENTTCNACGNSTTPARQRELILTEDKVIKLKGAINQHLQLARREKERLEEGIARDFGSAQLREDKSTAVDWEDLRAREAEVKDLAKELNRVVAEAEE